MQGYVTITADDCEVDGLYTKNSCLIFILETQWSIVLENSSAVNAILIRSCPKVYEQCM